MVIVRKNPNATHETAGADVMNAHWPIVSAGGRQGMRSARTRGSGHSIPAGPK